MVGTKRQIVDTLRQLLEEEPLEKITVKEICAHVGISRNTYYHHFENKYQPIIWMFKTDFVNRRMDELSCGGWVALSSIIHYLSEDRAFFAAVFMDAESDSFSAYFDRFNYLLIYNTMKPVYRDLFGNDEKALCMGSQILTIVEHTAIVEWLNDPTCPTPEEFLRQYSRHFRTVSRAVSIAFPALGEEKTKPISSYSQSAFTARPHPELRQQLTIFFH